MARSIPIRSNQYPFHFTARSNNKEWFNIPIPDFWRILLKIMAEDFLREALQVHAFVLMSNHFHLIASPIDCNIDEPMSYLLREVSRSGNPVFDEPHKWSLITSTSYYLQCLKYVYRNPVNAGICQRVEDYPFSSISAHQNPHFFPFPIRQWRWAGDWMKWGDYSSILQWLNTPHPFGLSDYLKLRGSCSHF